MPKKNQPSRLTNALLDTADDMRRVGIMDPSIHKEIAGRHLGENEEIEAEPAGSDGTRSPS